MATGTYHKFNFLKFRILDVLVKAYPFSLTCKEIADKGDIELKKVADALNHYKRLNKKSKSGKYRYKINKAGIVAYLQYKRRIEAGFDLNLHRRFPERVNSYSGITKQGVLELGLEAGEEAQRAE